MFYSVIGSSLFKFTCTYIKIKQLILACQLSHTKLFVNNISMLNIVTLINMQNQDENKIN